MIRINLLPQKRPKRQAGRRGRAAEPSAKHLVYGLAALVAAALGVALLVDLPMRSAIAEHRRDSDALREELAGHGARLAGFAELQKAQADAAARTQSIDRLLRAKVVPAHVLHELGEILTTSRNPKMTSEMKARTASDPNKRLQEDWDPSRVWLSGYADNNGVFKLEGGAQNEADVAQLAKRLAASVHFLDVTPAGGERVTDQASGVSYFKFTITGRVAY